MKTLIKSEFTLSPSLINCFCTKETDNFNPIFFPVMVTQKPFYLPAAQFLLIAESCLSLPCSSDLLFPCGGIFNSRSNDHLPCKLNFHSPCGSYYSLLVKKQLYHRVHHWASTNRDTYTHGLRASSWKAVVWITHLYYRIRALSGPGHLPLAPKWWNNMCAVRKAHF